MPVDYSQISQERRASLEVQHRLELEQKFTIRHPRRSCKSGNDIVYICSNPTCTAYALFCDRSSCGHCSAHENCEKSYLRDITKLLQNRSGNLKKFLQRFTDIQNRLFESALTRRKAYF